jgi:hypothetical protein
MNLFLKLKPWEIQEGKKENLKRLRNWARCWWYTSVILATQEAEIRRIEVQGQSWQIVGDIKSRKYATHKRAGRLAQVVEHLPSNREALKSNSTTAKKKKKGETDICPG